MAAIAYPTTGGRPRHGTPSRPPLRLVDGRRSQVAGKAHRRSAVERRRTVYRRRRLLVGGLVIMAVLTVVGAVATARLAVGALAGGPLTSSETPIAHAVPASSTSYLVRPGDTLWSIARAIHPSGDVRPYVSRLAAQLHGNTLQPGERILLP